MKILADATLPALHLAFDAPFVLTLYQTTHDLMSLLPGQDILLCRSTLKVNEALLKHNQLRFVATASSGTDHIDVDYLRKKSISLLDAKGANANAVADYVMASLAYLSIHQSLNPRKAAVIGLGHVGTKVATRLRAAKLEVLCYDPPKAQANKRFVSAFLEDVFDCDLICVHANLHASPPFPSKHLIDASFLKRLRHKTILINAARGDIVDESSLLLYADKVVYCTDVFSNEPYPNPEIISLATLCTPHIAGHSIEAKKAAILQISQALRAATQMPALLEQSFASFSLPSVDNNSTWQRQILSLYNPAKESIILKNAKDLQDAFLNLRKKHIFRHDFCTYHWPYISNSHFKIMGYEEKTARTIA